MGWPEQIAPVQRYTLNANTPVHASIARPNMSVRAPENKSLPGPRILGSCACRDLECCLLCSTGREKADLGCNSSRKTTCTLDQRARAAQRLYALVQRVDRQALDDTIVSGTISLLDDEDDAVRYWAAGCIGLLGDLARAARPKLERLLPAADCLEGSLTSSSSIRFALQQMSCCSISARMQDAKLD